MLNVADLLELEPTRRKDKIFLTLELIMENFLSENEAILWINTVHSALKMFNVQDKQGLSSIYTISENDTLLTSLELVKELTKWFTNFLAIADSGLQPRSLSLPKSLVHSILSLLPTLISVSDCVTKESNHILNVDRNQILSSEELLNCLLQVTCAPSLFLSSPRCARKCHPFIASRASDTTANYSIWRATFERGHYEDCTFHFELY